jgi:3-dehydroquinate dehydratase-2
VILLVNGPNLNLLGEREPEIYGAATLADVERLVEETCARFGFPVKAFQSNSEGAILDFLQAHRREARGIIVNPGALTHSSYALHDCLKAIPVPAVEVHVSNVHQREEWRRRSVVSPAVNGVIAGLGIEGYALAATWLCRGAPARAKRPGSGTVLVQGAPPQPVEGHEASGRRAFEDRATDDLAEFGGPPDPIPVDVTKRGEYEPL